MKRQFADANRMGSDFWILTDNELDEVNGGFIRLVLLAVVVARACSS